MGRDRPAGSLEGVALPEAGALEGATSEKAGPPTKIEVVDMLDPQLLSGFHMSSFGALSAQ
jgi:hypothetical protein